MIYIYLIHVKSNCDEKGYYLVQKLYQGKREMMFAGPSNKFLYVLVIEFSYIRISLCLISTPRGTSVAVRKRRACGTCVCTCSAYESATGVEYVSRWFH